MDFIPGLQLQLPPMALLANHGALGGPALLAALLPMAAWWSWLFYFVDQDGA